MEDLDAIKPERKSGAIVMIPIAQLAALNNDPGSPVWHPRPQLSSRPALTSVARAICRRSHTWPVSLPCRPQRPTFRSRTLATCSSSAAGAFAFRVVTWCSCGQQAHTCHEFRTSESGNSLVLDVEGFMYDEEMMDDSSAEQLTEEVPSSSHFRIIK